MHDTTLSALDQFLSAVYASPAYSQEEQKSLAVHAQVDGEARKAFVESFLRYVTWIARSYAKWCKHLDMLDIAQMGYEVLLDRLDRALQHPDPAAYLSMTVKKQLLWLCLRHDSLITVPTHASVHQIDSIDVPVHDDTTTTLADLLPDASADEPLPEKDHTTLYAALDQLSEDHRLILARRYGLLCQSRTSQGDLAREWFPNLPLETARDKVDRCEESALIALKHALASAERVQSFYLMADIERLYGVSDMSVRYLVKTGRLTRYPAPSEGCYSKNNKIRYVYNRAEVDAIFRRKSVPTLHARRSTLDERRSTLDAKGETLNAYAPCEIEEVA
jgi:DNA-directed RNA polymerase specialized sigma24 family protein